MGRSYNSLPGYLKKYCVVQDYDRYTEREHAAWRYIMRQNIEYFRDHALPVYREGLQKTGIPLERIPSIDEMDDALSKFGWGAVAVVGFIPPAAFLEFQARGCLPIATDMRTLEHVSYTPAPDIVHEAAGHAPIIADPEYAEYLRQYAAMAQKAIISSEDVALYEAIRLLSDIKENPDTKPGAIEQAERELRATAERMTHVSEAGKVARMAWWTVEYGLLGPMEHPLIYGAGLLSSVGESQNCLSERVRKVPLSIECVHTAYDITKPQPQLFIAPSIQTLKDVLEEFDQGMSYRRGGQLGLDQAMKAKSVNTVELDSGIQVAGIVTGHEADRNSDAVDFVKFSGPCQICYKDKELANQGRDRHPEGFSGPLGRWSALSDRHPRTFQPADLEKMGLRANARGQIDFINGFKVKGVLREAQWKDGRLVLLTFEQCSVERTGKAYFQPEWGPFDLVVGDTVTSVRGGPASKEEFGEYQMGLAHTQPGRTSPYTPSEYKSFGLYRRLREIRTSMSVPNSLEKITAELKSVATKISESHPSDWLIAVELLEIAHQANGGSIVHQGWMRDVQAHLQECGRKGDEQTRQAIARGVALIGVR